MRTETFTATPAATRIGDAERDLAVERLAAHYAEGRLTRTEFDERSALALAARTAPELDALFTDLPSAAEPPSGVAASPAVSPAGGDSSAALELWREGVLHNWLVFCMVAVVAMATSGQPWILVPMAAWGLRVFSARGRAQRDPQAFLAARTGGRGRRRETRRHRALA